MDMFLALFVGILVGLGLLLLLLGAAGTVPVPKIGRDDDGNTFNYPMVKQLMWPVITFIAVFAATQWIVAAVAAAGAGAMLPRQMARNRAEAEHVRKTEALASWIEMLRDGIVSGGGLEGPLMRSAETGPEYLRPYLRQLLDDMRVEDTETALFNFAAGVEHHIADMLVASYSLATRESTAGLPDLLRSLSDAANLEVKTYRRVEVSRKQLRSSVKITFGVLGAFAIGSLLFARDLMDAYDDATGQMVLLLIAGLLMGGYVWMQRLQLIRRPPRFFALDLDDEEALS
jgi:tight adherence protein B